MGGIFNKWRVNYVFADELEEKQEKFQREVVDAQHGVNFVMVRDWG